MKAGAGNPWAAVRAVALDLDGVVYAGQLALPGAPAAVQQLRAAGLSIFFVTNSSVKTRAEIAAKLTALGIPAAESEVYTSAYAAGQLLIQLSGSPRPTALALGTTSLRQELSASGVQLVAPGEPCEYLVVGLDPEFNYTTLTQGVEALLRGAKLVACNRDGTFPVAGGRVLPGCGALVGALEAATGKAADYEAGKPDPFLLALLAAREQLTPAEIVVIGDTVSSDLVMAQRFGSLAVWIAPDAPAGMEWVTCKTLSAAAAWLLMACKG